MASTRAGCYLRVNRGRARPRDRQAGPSRPRAKGSRRPAPTLARNLLASIQGRFSAGQSSAAPYGPQRRHPPCDHLERPADRRREKTSARTRILSDAELVRRSGGPPSGYAIRTGPLYQLLILNGAPPQRVRWVRRLGLNLDLCPTGYGLVHGQSHEGGPMAGPAGRMLFRSRWPCRSLPRRPAALRLNSCVLEYAPAKTPVLDRRQDQERSSGGAHVGATLRAPQPVGVARTPGRWTLQAWRNPRFCVGWCAALSHAWRVNSGSLPRAPARRTCSPASRGTYNVVRFFSTRSEPQLETWGNYLQPDRRSTDAIQAARAIAAGCQLRGR